MRLTAALPSVAFLAIVLSPIAAAHADDYCDKGTGWACEVENSGDKIDISAGQSRPGSPPENPGRPHGPSNPDDLAPDAPEEAEECGPLGCRGGYAVEGLPEVTLADLASFRPATPELTGEPAGFGVVGMPTNLVGAASEQLLSGTLLGWDVTVRFVPAEFVFSHGDGTSATTTTGGASWARLAQAQFTPTATSHVYGDRGTYPVSVTVRYAASVDFGTGLWLPVDGFVTATSGDYDVRVVEVRTALVDETCRENPTGPGC